MPFIFFSFFLNLSFLTKYVHIGFYFNSGKVNFNVCAYVFLCSDTSRLKWSPPNVCPFFLCARFFFQGPENTVFWCNVKNTLSQKSIKIVQHWFSLKEFFKERKHAIYHCPFFCGPFLYNSLHSLFVFLVSLSLQSSYWRVRVYIFGTEPSALRQYLQATNSITSRKCFVDHSVFFTN